MKLIKIPFKLIIVFLIIFVPVKTMAQSLRPPSPSEKNALTTVVDSLSQIINLFVNQNWEITDNNFDPELYVPNSKSAHCGIGYTITLKLRPGSKIVNQGMADIQRFLKENRQDSIEAAYAAMEKASTIHIDIELNSSSVGLGTLPKQNKQLEIPGVAKAFIVQEDNYTTRREGAFVLAFGNWRNAKYDSANKCYRFHFQHPPQSPYIENITMEIYGANDQIKRALKLANWQILNDTLTK